MKKPHHPTLPTKREPIRKGVVKTLFAMTNKNRKQRVAASGVPGDFEAELPGRKIGMALAVIVGVHVVAAGLVFFHHWRLEGRGGDATAANLTSNGSVPALLTPTANFVQPRITSPNPHMVTAGERYDTIAAQLGVDEKALRDANNDAPLRGGMPLNVPPKKIVALDPPEVDAIKNSQPKYDGIIDTPRAIVVSEGKPQLVKPNVGRTTASSNTAENFHAVEGRKDKPKEKVEETPRATAKEKKESTDKKVAAKTPSIPKAKPVTASKSYTVKEGDSLWKIATKMKMDPDQLKKANGISDSKKLKPGMTLTIPNANG